MLHTYGTIGVLTRVELRLVPAREYVPLLVQFDDIAATAAFGYDLVSSPAHARLVSLQQAPIGTMLSPLRGAVDPAAHLALLWVAAEDVDAVAAHVEAHGGRLTREWPTPTHISQFPFSHTVLRSRKADPASSWLRAGRRARDLLRPDDPAQPGQARRQLLHLPGPHPAQRPRRPHPAVVSRTTGRSSGNAPARRRRLTAGSVHRRPAPGGTT
ncbi:hypothetical protein GCM10023215_37430 [Pseudonocardia yuanmonensis]|uniref:VOC domain-containing protein n=1 Tax=Pseudonocardia yuanmonensis TaxID=1095914 RepID=A0ABP8WWY7_9PSEU